MVQQNENRRAHLFFLNVHTAFTEPVETPDSQVF